MSRDPPDDRFPEGEAKVFRTPTLRLGRSVGIGKIIDYGLFFAGSFFVAFRLPKRPDRVIVLSTPPFLSCFARVFSKVLRADHGHWIMDIYPDVIHAHGLMTNILKKRTSARDHLRVGPWRRDNLDSRDQIGRVDGMSDQATMPMTQILGE